MTRTDAAAPPAADTRLRVRTVPVDETAPLVPRLDPRHPLLWMRRGEGMIGLGEVLRIETAGPDRVERAADGWRRLAAAADVDDRVGLPGSGLVAFGLLAGWFVHVMVNVGMTVGVMPITGIPLPFFSYGGSFMLASWLAIGVLIRISSEGRGQLGHVGV